MNLLCIIGIHKWNALHYKTLESVIRHKSQYTKVLDKKVTREYCIRCGKIRNLIEFNDEIIWKDPKKPQSKKE